MRSPRPESVESISDSVWLVGAATFAAILTLIGLVAPAVAGRVGLWLVIGVAAIAAAWGFQSLTRSVLRSDKSIFEPAATDLDRQRLPLHLEQLRPNIAPKRRWNWNRRKTPALAYGARFAVRSIAMSRLWTNHQLDARYVRDHLAIKELVSPRLFSMIRADVSSADTHFWQRTAIKQSELGGILDELEKL